MMRLLTAYVIFFTLAVVLFPLSAQAQAPTKSMGYPDLDLYHSQLEKNTSYDGWVHQQHLIVDTPLDTLMVNYIKNHGRWSDADLLFKHLAHITGGRDMTESLPIMEKVIPDARRKYHNKHLDLALEFFVGVCISTRVLDMKMEQYEQVLRKARKIGDANMEALCLSELWTHSTYNHFYARSFVHAKRLEEALEKVDEGYTRKGLDYYDLGASYYNFKDYDRALPLLYKSFAAGGCGPQAGNYLASYHQMNGNLDSAAYYNRYILASDEALWYSPAHLAIAISNLGRIEQERGNTDAAIAMLQAGLAEMNNRNDPSFVAGLHISLGKCYLEKGNMAAVKEHLSNSRQNVEQLDHPVALLNRQKDLYALESSYNSALGRSGVARTYLDSALVATRQYEQLTGQHNILLGEQQLQEAQTEVQRQQIARQRNIIWSVIAGLILITLALIYIIRLYRKRNAAYKALARKAEEWAHQTVAPERFTAGETNAKNKREPDTEEDRRIIGLANGEMTENHAYREPALTLDMLADRLGVTRNALSHAVNRTTGGNFSNYINGYRIKEAVRILSETERTEIYIEQIYERVGFGNRNSFYRTFRQFTGLSPADFQKNKENHLR